MNRAKDSRILTGHRPSWRHRLPASRGRTGQATVEFALVSILFLMMVLGTFDFGRAVYMNSQLTNAVREGARYGQVAPTDTAGIKNRVIGQSHGLGLSSANIIVTCSASCTSGNNVTVKANMKFTFVAQEFLGVSPLTMHAQATDVIQ